MTYKLVAWGRYRVAPFLIRKWYVLESEGGRTMSVNVLLLKNKPKIMIVEEGKKVRVYTDEKAERKYAELLPKEARRLK
jgi:hypothetical protein